MTEKERELCFVVSIVMVRPEKGSLNIRNILSYVGGATSQDEARGKAVEEAMDENLGYQINSILVSEGRWIEEVQDATL